jgi:hypothetical protein
MPKKIGYWVLMDFSYGTCMVEDKETGELRPSTVHRYPVLFDDLPEIFSEIR